MRIVLAGARATMATLVMTSCSSSGGAPPDGGPGEGPDAPAQAGSDATSIDGTSVEGGGSGDGGGEATAPGDGSPDGTLGDSGSDAACSAGSSLYFADPGCDLAPMCRGDGQDACAGTYCGCDGVTFLDGCDHARRAFAHRGCCDGECEGGATPTGDR